MNNNILKSRYTKLVVFSILILLFVIIRSTFAKFESETEGITIVNGVVALNQKKNVLKATTSSDSSAFRSSTYKNYIKNITFQNETEIPSTAVASWDISQDQNGGVMAYVIRNASNSSYYDMFIQSEDQIYANEDMSYWFANLKGLDSINGLELLNTSDTVNMSRMFYYTGSNSKTITLDLGQNFDTSNVIDMSYMFYYLGQSSTALTFDLGDSFDTSNVTNMECMFANLGFNSEILEFNLGDKFDTSKVTNMSYMFSGLNLSRNQKNFNLGNKFDTSSVTNMAGMFAKIDNRAFKGLEIDLGDKFDTSNVTNMSYMFSFTGNYSGDVVIDLGNKFDTSNVTNMSYMFEAYSQNGESILSLGNNFDTSKVTDMSYMFSNGGFKTIDLGNNFDTSRVNTMQGMFMNTTIYDSDSGSGVLDLKEKFNTLNVSNMKSMFSSFNPKNSVKNIILDLGPNFDTSNVINMSSMFANFGEYAESIDLNIGTKFTTSKVTNMSSMFSSFNKNNSKTNITIDFYKNFDTSNVKDMSYMFANFKQNSSNVNIEFGENFSTTNVTNMSYMFNNTGSNSSSVTINVGSKFDTSKVTNMSYMFSGLGKVASSVNVDIGSKFVTPKVTNMSYMFSDFASADPNFIFNIGNGLSFESVTNADNMFNKMGYSSSKLNIRLAVKQLQLNGKANILTNVAMQSGSSLAVDFVCLSEDLVDAMIATKSNGANVIKGNELDGPCTKYSITTDNSIVVPSKASALPTEVIKLSVNQEGKSIVSFKLNGETITGDVFEMPSANAVITDIVIRNVYVVETGHNPYLNNMSGTFYEKTFTGAKQLKVKITYQTENINYDWINIYDGPSSTVSGYYHIGGYNLQTSEFVINGSYIKIEFITDSSGNNYYGFKAEIEPVY